MDYILEVSVALVHIKEPLNVSKAVMETMIDLKAKGHKDKY